jgi:hypothetical protein
VTCPDGATVNIGSITLNGGITVNFNVNGSASTTYNFSGSISNTGTALTFGPGTFNIAGGISTGGGTTTTFGAGTFNIGTSSGVGSGNYSIYHSGTTLTFGGPSTFTLKAGIYNSGGSTLTLGSGTTNSYQIGSGSTGDAFNLGGGSKTTLADATGSSSVFKVVGNVNVTSGGGSCLTLPTAAQHDIKGFLSTAGGTILGSGVYTVTGYVALGANGGGNVTCSGSSVGVSGSGVTFVIGASSTLSSGTCASMAFCVAAGYSNVTLTAPTSGTTQKIVMIGPTTSTNTAGALFTQGASGTSLSGAVYFPNGPVTLSGGASLGGGTGQCLQLIGSQVSLSGVSRAREDVRLL